MNFCWHNFNRNALLHYQEPLNNCAPDLKRQMCKLYANVNMIIRKFSRCSLDVKCFFYLNPIGLTCIVPYYGMIVLKLH